LRNHKVLKPGLFITIEIRPRQSWPFTIGSTSDDFNTITCELLMEQPRSIEIKSGEEFIIVCATESGIYKFPTRVVEIEQDPVRLKLSLLKGTVRVQRREFFRLSRPLVRARYRPVNGPDDILTDNLIEAPVKDLSGNGMSFIIDKSAELPSGSPLRTEIEVANGRTIGLVGQVVRCIPDEPIIGKSLLCVHFALIDEVDRDRIVGHLFKEQIDRAGKRRRSPRRN